MGFLGHSISSPGIGPDPKVEALDRTPRATDVSPSHSRPRGCPIIASFCSTSPSAYDPLLTCSKSTFRTVSQREWNAPFEVS